MISFSHQRLCHYTETVYCRLLLLKGQVLKLCRETNCQKSDEIWFALSAKFDLNLPLSLAQEFCV